MSQGVVVVSYEKLYIFLNVVDYKY